MPVSSFLSILFLAFVAALFSVEGARSRSNVQRDPNSPYLRWFFTVEAFYRAFIVNLGFGGVSLALSVISVTSTWGFWDWNAPVLPLLANFIWGLIAAYDLADEYRPPHWSRWWVIGGGLLLCFYAGAVAYSLYRHPSG
jgi:hypothetical protein